MITIHTFADFKILIMMVSVLYFFGFRSIRGFENEMQMGDFDLVLKIIRRGF